jgi:hypothetical protein
VPQRILVERVLEHNTGQNRNFTSKPNTGTAGGALIGTPFDGPIGSGPSNGHASGISGLLLQPELTISKTIGASVVRLDESRRSLFNGYTTQQFEVG